MQTAGSTAVSIGTFDGVHLGHRAILTELRRQADRLAVPALVYAFSVPPRASQRPPLGRVLLLPEAAKRRILLRTVDQVLPAPFARLRHLPPADFADTVLAEELHARAVVVGSSFRFGADRAGDPELLRKLGARHGCAVTVVPPLIVAGAPVTSTRIRSLLATGDVAGAAELLGRPAVVIGDVVPGDRIGRRLGFPTANLVVDRHVLLPRDGIYAAHAFVTPHEAASPRPAVLYVGTRPSVPGDEERRCELFLLDAPDRELYGDRVEVHLVDRLRDDRRFDTFEMLRAQIARDVHRAAEHLATRPAFSPPIGS